MAILESFPEITVAAAPVDVSAGLADGTYELQVRPPKAVIFAVKAVAPISPGDYFVQLGTFTFIVRTGSLPVWVRALSGTVVIKRWRAA